MSIKQKKAYFKLELKKESRLFCINSRLLCIGKSSSLYWKVVFFVLIVVFFVLIVVFFVLESRLLCINIIYDHCITLLIALFLFHNLMGLTVNGKLHKKYAYIVSFLRQGHGFLYTSISKMADHILEISRRTVSIVPN